MCLGIDDIQWIKSHIDMQQTWQQSQQPGRPHAKGQPNAQRRNRRRNTARAFALKGFITYFKEKRREENIEITKTKAYHTTRLHLVMRTSPLLRIQGYRDGCTRDTSPPHHRSHAPSHGEKNISHARRRDDAALGLPQPYAGLAADVKFSARLVVVVVGELLLGLPLRDGIHAPGGYDGVGLPAKLNWKRLSKPDILLDDGRHHPRAHRSPALAEGEPETLVHDNWTDQLRKGERRGKHGKRGEGGGGGVDTYETVCVFLPARKIEKNSM